MRKCTTWRPAEILFLKQQLRCTICRDLAHETVKQNDKHEILRIAPSRRLHILGSPLYNRRKISGNPPQPVCSRETHPMKRNKYKYRNINEAKQSWHAFQTILLHKKSTDLIFTYSRLSKLAVSLATTLWYWNCNFWNFDEGLRL